MLNNSKCGTFLSCLEFAILTSVYSEVVLKPRQVICLVKIFLNWDVLAVLPTGYGKSLIFHLLPGLLFAKKNAYLISREVTVYNSIVIVVSPLNALISNQISRLNSSGIRASALDVTNSALEDFGEKEDELVCDLQFSDKKQLENGFYNILFAHPESLVSCQYGRNLMQTKVYQDNVCAIVVDEAHCILEWGRDFRVDYGNLAVLCAIFSNVPVLAMTATANMSDRKSIKESLGLKSCAEVVGNPDHSNILYLKYFRVGQDVDSITNILNPIAEGLLQEQIHYPLTIIYVSLKWCGFAYKLFESILGNSQYYPQGSSSTPENRLFAQFHSPQTKQMKEGILKQLCSSKSKIRVVFATVALGMGVDIQCIRSVIHISPPFTMQAYSQETGHAGRDGLPSNAILYYNNHDIARNKNAMQEAMRTFCKNEDSCLRMLLLRSLDTDPKDIKPISPRHLCCSVCQQECPCFNCAI